MANTVRVTITVPRDLKTRMDAIEEAINWSAVASRAFEQTLADLITRRGVRQMEDVVNRLRASKAKHESAKHQEGFKAGKAWAEQSAEASELMGLFEVDPDVRFDDDHPGRDARGVGWEFVATIRMEPEPDHADAAQFWSEEAGVGDGWSDLMYDGKFVQGFAEGAVSVWAEVKDKL